MSNHNSDEQLKLDFGGDSSDDNDIHASGIVDLVCEACCGRSFQRDEGGQLSCRNCHARVDNLAVYGELDDFHPQAAGRYPVPVRQVAAQPAGKGKLQGLQKGNSGRLGRGPPSAQPGDGTASVAPSHTRPETEALDGFAVEYESDGEDEG